MERIKQRLDPTKVLEGEQDMAKVWKAQTRSSPTKEAYEKRLAGIWQETGCAAKWAPYVVPQLLFRLVINSSAVEGPSFLVSEAQGGLIIVIGSPPFEAQSPQVPALAAAFLDKEHCPGAHGLSEADKATLKEIRDRSPPPSPKQ